MSGSKWFCGFVCTCWQKWMVVDEIF